MEVLPGISVRLTPGHVPYHQAVLVRDAAATRRPSSADLIPTTAHLPLPWIMGYDLEPLRTLESKRALLRGRGGGRLAAGVRARSRGGVGDRGGGGEGSDPPGRGGGEAGRGGERSGSVILNASGGIGSGGQTVLPALEQLPAPPDAYPGGSGREDEPGDGGELTGRVWTVKDIIGLMNPERLLPSR